MQKTKLIVFTVLNKVRTIILQTYTEEYMHLRPVINLELIW
jgi:hypothetical protein